MDPSDPPATETKSTGKRFIIPSVDDVEKKAKEKTTLSLKRKPSSDSSDLRKSASMETQDVDMTGSLSMEGNHLVLPTNNPTTTSFAETFSFIKDTAGYASSSTSKVTPEVVRPGNTDSTPIIYRSGVTNSVVVNSCQRGNPLLKGIRNVAWEYGEIIPDYVMGQTTCALFLSLKYHRLHPGYIYERIKKLSGHYLLRVLLCLIDCPDPEVSLRELSKTAVINNFTLLLSWSYDEAGRYIETFKAYEKKSPDLIKEQVKEDYLSKLTDCLTSIKTVNKTNVITLSSSFGSHGPFRYCRIIFVTRVWRAKGPTLFFLNLETCVNEENRLDACMKCFIRNLKVEKQLEKPTIVILRIQRYGGSKRRKMENYKVSRPKMSNAVNLVPFAVLDDPLYTALLRSLRENLYILLNLDQDLFEKECILHSHFFSSFLRQFPRSSWSDDEVLLAKAFFELYYRMLESQNEELKHFLWSIPNILSFTELFHHKKSDLQTIFSPQISFISASLSLYAPSLHSFLQQFCKSFKYRLAKAGKSSSITSDSCHITNDTIDTSLELISTFLSSHYYFLEFFPTTINLLNEDNALLLELSELYNFVLCLLNCKLENSPDGNISNSTRLMVALRSNTLTLFKVCFEQTFLINDLNNALKSECTHFLLSLTNSTPDSDLLLPSGAKRFSLIADYDVYFVLTNRLIEWQNQMDMRERDLLESVIYSINESRRNADILGGVLIKDDMMECKEVPTTLTAKPCIEDESSNILSIKELLPHLGKGFIKRCLIYYKDNVESTIANLLEDTLPPELAMLEKSSEEVNFTEEPTEEDSLKTRSNIFDGDEYDIFSHPEKNLDEIRYQPEILQGLQDLKIDDGLKDRTMNLLLLSQYEDEYVDTYDTIGMDTEPIEREEEDPEGDSTKNKRLTGIKNEKEVPQQYENWEDTEKILVQALHRSTKCFERVGRKSDERKQLKEQIKWTDEQIEGWYSQLKKSGRLNKVVAKYEFDGSQSSLPRQRYRKSGQDSEASSGEISSLQGPPEVSPQTSEGGNFRGRGRGGYRGGRSSRKKQSINKFTRSIQS